MAKKGEYEKLDGRRFGRWRVIRLFSAPYTDEYKRRHVAMWTCKCDCGNEKPVAATSLKNGDSSSCGCLNSELRRARSLKHGMRRATEYGVWCGIKSRTTNPNIDSYKDYGARGIVMCAEWMLDFTAFLGHVGLRPSPLHSLERKDNDKGYEPGNVVWATRLTQANNTRANRSVAIGGVTRTIAQWCRELGRNYKTVHARITSGWDEENAILTSTDEGRKVRKVATQETMTQELEVCS